MAMRGEQLGVGYIKGIGMVKIFHDMDSTKHFFCLDNRDRWRYVGRSRVQFRKGARRG